MKKISRNIYIQISLIAHMYNKKKVLFYTLILFLSSLVAAQDIVLDITTDKQIYLPGQNITFTVVLLEENIPIKETLNVVLEDNAQKKQISLSAITNERTMVVIEKEFPSGYWSISVNYRDKEVKRFFSVSESEEADFRIVGDKLIIKNIGNAPYTKTVQILIGEKIITQKQSIRVGEQKEIRLVAPDGKYNIQVSDGTQTITKSDVFLTGTGKVIGALDEEITKSSPSVLGGARDPDEEDRFVFSQHFSTSFIFIAAVGVLGILLFVERMMRRKANVHIQHNINKIAAQHK